jgi:alpha-tubulin suppressor-like RCC1 family protein
MRLAMRTGCLLAATIAAVAGCREPTEIVLEVSTDLFCGYAVPVTQIRTGPSMEAVEGTAPVAETEACEPSGRIGSLVMVPQGDDSKPAAIKVVMTFTSNKFHLQEVSLDTCLLQGGGQGCIVARRSLHFVPHTKLVLPIEMHSDCENVVCPPSETCVHEICVPAAIDPAQCLAPGGCPNPVVPPDAGFDAGPCRPGAAHCLNGTDEVCENDGVWHLRGQSCMVMPGIAAGSAHSCALRRDGRVQCWGDNSMGQLGLGDANDRGDQSGEMGSGLATVDLGTGRYAVAVVAAHDRTCALLDDLSFKCWGANPNGELGFPEPNGQAHGDGAGEMGDALPPIRFGPDRDIQYIALGEAHTCAISNNRVKCWGANARGALGSGDTAPRIGVDGTVPDVDLGNGIGAYSLTAGSEHTCAVLGGGAVKCWGRNSESFAGVLGLGDQMDRGSGPGQMGQYLPLVSLGMPAGAHQVAWLTAGAQHTCAFLFGRNIGELLRLKCWGQNAEGQLGLNDTRSRGGAPGEMGDDLPPTLVLMPPPPTPNEEAFFGGFALGRSHTCALVGGMVKCWGRNLEGQLGRSDVLGLGGQPGDMPDKLVPVGFGRARKVVAIAAGDFYSCALFEDDHVKCWGKNDHGQLGQGDIQTRMTAGNELPDIDLGP